MPTHSAEIIDFTTYAERRVLEQPQPDLPYHLEVRAQLLADLATWPLAFRRRLGDRIEYWTRDADCAEWIERRVDRSRAPEAEATPLDAFSSCRCGCLGFHGELARELDGLRRAVANYRSARKGRTRANRKERVDWEKTAVLEYFWQHGRRRVDRRALAEHAIAAGRHEIEQCESSLERAQESLAYYRERLKSNRYLKGPKIGRRLSPQTRYGFRLNVGNARTAMLGDRGRIRHLRRLLKDVPALVREFTHCERRAEAA